MVQLHLSVIGGEIKTITTALVYYLSLLAKCICVTADYTFTF